MKPRACLKIKWTLCYRVIAFFIQAFLLQVAFAWPQEIGLVEADRLINDPSLTYEQAHQAFAILEAKLKKGQSKTERFSIQVNLTKICFKLGDLAADDHRLDWYQKGQHYAGTLSQAKPESPAGYYWLAMNLSGEADVHQSMKSLKLLPRIVNQLELSLARDPVYERAGAHRVLGRIYYAAPDWPLSIGNIEKSYYHLNAAVQLAPENSTNHLYLAKTLIRMKRPVEACTALQMAIKYHTPDMWPALQEDDRKEAQESLKICWLGRIKKTSNQPGIIPKK